MKRLGVFAVAVGIVCAVSAACDGVYRVVTPYCPVSDSAVKHADSIPAVCFYVDTLRRKP